MPIGNLIQLEAKGPEDAYLYGNPQTTYFKHVYKRATNFAVDYYKISQNYFQHVEFGKTIKIKVPHNGDLMGGLYLEMQFEDIMRRFDFRNIDQTVDRKPKFTSYVNGIGFNLIDEISITINGITIERLTGEMIFLINELTNEQCRKESFYKMTGYFPTTFEVGDSNTSNLTCYLYVPFFFTKDPSVYLPICALHHSEIYVEIKLRPIEKCLVHHYNYNGSHLPGQNGFDSSAGAPPRYQMYAEDVTYGIKSIDMYMKSIFLDRQEQILFKNRELSYLVELYQIGNAERFRAPFDPLTHHYIDLTFYGPTKYVFWVVQREDVFDGNMYDNYSYDYRSRYGDGIYAFQYNDHLLQSGVITIDNNEITSINNPIFLSSVQLYENFRVGSNIPFYNYSFSLKPCQSDPTGTLNFSKVLRKHLRVSFVRPELFSTPENNVPNLLFRGYSCAYNMLTIKDGFAGLLFTK